MLNQLSIKNLAIIDDITIDFSDGFSVLTGETGAGKSIIIDALNLVFGGKGQQELIAYGKDFAKVVASLSLDKNIKKYIYDNYAIDVEDECIISRTLNRNGKQVCKINDEIISLSSLATIGNMIIDISSQDEKTYLLVAKNHQKLLDNYIMGIDSHFKDEYDKAYSKYIDAKRRLDDLNKNSIGEDEAEFLRYKYNELKDFNYSKEDEENIKSQYKEMESLKRNSEAFKDIIYLLYNDNDGLDSKFYELTKRLTPLSNSVKVNEYLEKFNSLYLDFDDLASNFKKEFKIEDIDDNYISSLEDKITLINKLKRKYNTDDLLHVKEDIKNKLDEYENKEMLLSHLTRDFEGYKDEVIKQGEKLLETYKKYGKTLEDKVVEELSYLYLQDAIFKVNYNRRDNITVNGLYDIEFYMQTNKGLPPMPLIKVASGGETSRIMLGLKSVFCKYSSISTIIFDEIDTGVSGKIAQAIGRKMEDIAKDIQVIAISHLPQVAALADNSYYIYKIDEDGTTKTHVKILDENEKVLEVARLLAGNNIKDTYKSAALELIKEKGNG